MSVSTSCSIALYRDTLSYLPCVRDIPVILRAIAVTRSRPMQWYVRTAALAQRVVIPCFSLSHHRTMTLCGCEPAVLSIDRCRSGPSSPLLLCCHTLSRTTLWNLNPSHVHSMANIAGPKLLPTKCATAATPTNTSPAQRSSGQWSVVSGRIHVLPQLVLFAVWRRLSDLVRSLSCF